MNQHVFPVPPPEKRCGFCAGGGWLGLDGKPFFYPDGEPVDWTQPNHIECGACLARGDSLESFSDQATPGEWWIEWESCDCGDGYPCGHSDWIVGVNGKSLENLKPEDLIFMVALVNNHRLSREAAP